MWGNIPASSLIAFRLIAFVLLVWLPVSHHTFEISLKKSPTCGLLCWPTWNRTKIFRTKIWRNSLYTIGHRQNKLRELTCCASEALRLFFLLNQNEFWFSLWGFILLPFRKRVQRYCFFLIWPNISAKKCKFSAFFCFLTSKSSLWPQNPAFNL